MIYVCAFCSAQFDAKPCAKRVFCSRECKNASERSFDFGHFMNLVLDGLEGKEIAAILKISRPRVTRLLRVHGLYETWVENRRLTRGDRTRPSTRRPKFDEKITHVNSLLAGWR